jgi:DNA repair protein RecO (recombination protein O)
MIERSLRNRLYTTEAIVLSRQDYSEADRIFVLFTPARGRMSVIAKGIRRPKSRFGSSLDYFGRVSLDLAKGRDLDVVTGVTAIDGHGRLRIDTASYGYAAYFAELTRHLTQDRQENRPLYNLLASSLALVNDGIEPWPVARHFELGILTMLGYRPEMFRCVNCSRDLEAVTNAFSARLGGILCPSCRLADPGAVPMSVDAQKYLRTLARSGLAAVMRLNVSPELRNEIAGIVATYLRFVAEREFASLRVMEAMLALPDSASAPIPAKP